MPVMDRPRAVLFPIHLECRSCASRSSPSTRPRNGSHRASYSGYDDAGLLANAKVPDRLPPKTQAAFTTDCSSGTLLGPARPSSVSSRTCDNHVVVEYSVSLNGCGFALFDSVR